MLFQVVEQLASSAGHRDQPSARVEVLSIGSQVLGQMIDASAQQGDLHVARPRIGIVRFEVADYLGFIDSFTMWHVMISDHGNGNLSLERLLAKLVAELTANTRLIIERPAEEDAV